MRRPFLHERSVRRVGGQPVARAGLQIGYGITHMRGYDYQLGRQAGAGVRARAAGAAKMGAIDQVWDGGAAAVLDVIPEAS